MSIKVVGAGLPRTGTMSLKYALEHLLGGTCYHMHELYLNPDHVALWHRVLDGETAILHEILDGYCAALDWPISAVWDDAATLFPGSFIVLSKRKNAEEWWASVDQTVWEIIRTQRFRFSDMPQEEEAFARLHDRLVRRFSPSWDASQPAQRAYDLHLEAVRASGLGDRVLEFGPGDGWNPICKALGLQVPSVPFPHRNQRADFQARNAL